jgi:hypothetical protein
VSWDDLPIKNGEESLEYQRLYYRYSHCYCPGAEEIDNCAAPWDCASKGRCYLIFKRTAATPARG